jgi:hypothetical protein
MLPGAQGLGEHNRDQVIPVPGQMGSLDCRIVNELNWLSARFHPLDLQGP